MKSMTPAQLREYVKAHGILLPNGQVKLTRPMFVFKKVYTSVAGYSSPHAIANLVIPIGAVVNLNQGDGRKMRASQAYCYSIAGVNNKKDLSTAISTHDRNFKYVSGKDLGLSVDAFKNLVENAEEYTKFDYYSTSDSRSHAGRLKKCKLVPSRFCNTTATCASGIHFFAELKDAKNY